MLPNWLTRIPGLRTVMSRRERRGSKLPRTRLRVEALEAREVPATITVTSLADNTTLDGQVTLREAIEAANTDTSVDGSVAGSGHDTIEFASGLTGTITLSGGQLDITSSLTITGPGASLLTVSGNNSTGIFVNSGTATLSGLTIANAYSPSGGGGIENTGTMSVESCVFTNNHGAAGGAIDSVATMTIRNCRFTGNSADNHGGAIYNNDGTMSVSGCTFSDNHAGSVDNFGGGAIASRTENNAGYLAINACTFTLNTANIGGALYLWGRLRLGGPEFTINNSTFFDNTADMGGAVFHQATGGVDYLTEFGGLLINSTIVGNKVGGGVFSYPVTEEAGFPPRPLLIQNCIIAQNEGGDLLNDGLFSIGHNLIGGGPAGGPFWTGTDWWVADSALLLAPLGDYGGPTQTMPPLPGSPALDNGGTSRLWEPTDWLIYYDTYGFGGLTDYLGNSFFATDQRGLTRIANGTIDIGAVEKQTNVTTVQPAVPGTPTVTLTADQGTFNALTAIAPGINGVAPLPTTGSLKNASLPVGAFDFTLEGITSTSPVTVTIIIPTGVTINKYLKYGLEPTDNPRTTLDETTTPHWWDFTWNGTTGARFQDVNGDGTKDVVLTLMDNQRGDDNATVGIIHDPGAPAFVPPIQVQIDVRSTINLASQGLIAAVVFSSADFSAALVDVGTVRFAGASAVGSSMEDVNGDGLLDLVLHFRTQDTTLRTLYEQLLADDVNEDGVLDSSHQEASIALTGTTTDNDQFEGSDTVDLFLSGKALRDTLASLAASGAI